MVTQVTNFGRNGLSDWLIQRVTGLCISNYRFLAGKSKCSI